MQEVVQEKFGEEETCPYLADQRSTMRYRFIRHCSIETYEQLLVRGWRRFGTVFFRPNCLSCWECRSLRVDVEQFRPNRSMRRTLNRNQDLKVIERRPTISDDHIDLYNRFHNDMAGRRDWPNRQSTPIDYYLTFVDGFGDFGHELLFVDGGRLIGVALVDVLPNAVSAVYCYYDPEERRRALGVYSVLKQIELARQRGAEHLYLGYWVAGNQSMRYKANYRPHEILEGRPALDRSACWNLVET